jgi:hypothetical protein
MKRREKGEMKKKKLNGKKNGKIKKSGRIKAKRE